MFDGRFNVVWSCFGTCLFSIVGGLTKCVLGTQGWEISIGGLKSAGRKFFLPLFFLWKQEGIDGWLNPKDMGILLRSRSVSCHSLRHSQQEVWRSNMDVTLSVKYCKRSRIKSMKAHSRSRRMPKSLMRNSPHSNAKALVVIARTPLTLNWDSGL